MTKYFVIMEEIGEYSSREVTPIFVLTDQSLAQKKVEELTKENKEDYRLWCLERDKIRDKTLVKFSSESAAHFCNNPGEKDYYIEIVERQE